MSTLIGVAWYDPAEWERLRAVAPDVETLEPTHAEWLAFAEERLASLRAAGHGVRRVPVEVAALQSWCNAQGRRADATARAEFASSELQRLYDEGVLGP